ncbi:MAG: hypothetical protein F9K40_08710 [Kofleriaceae bacterium]|nr:MAG: hypothetical protein F9K40_08710 [Kofleriaceae bacterium]
MAGRRPRRSRRASRARRRSDPQLTRRWDGNRRHIRLVAGPPPIRHGPARSGALDQRRHPEPGGAAPDELIAGTERGGELPPEEDPSDGVVEAQSGKAIRLAAETICVHGDGPNAVEIARTVRTVLAEEGVAAAAWQAPSADRRQRSGA